MVRSYTEKCPNKKHDPILEPIGISGISGRFPESDDIHEFQENLFSGVDMVTEDDRRWPQGLYGVPRGCGKLKTLDKFDASFFGVSGKQSNVMDPQQRILLELTYEAILDAGVNPETLRGSSTGVFIGCFYSESEEILLENPEEIFNGYEVTGNAKTMLANRISYVFDFQGPSFALDSACSSNLLALEKAVAAIRSGQCSSAIVGGVNLCLQPKRTLEFHRLQLLSHESRCKSFDADAHGYVN